MRQGQPACHLPAVAVPLAPVLVTVFRVRYSLNNHSEPEKKYICKTTGLNNLPRAFPSRKLNLKRFSKS